jgi:hypothetical protein
MKKLFVPAMVALLSLIAAFCAEAAPAAGGTGIKAQAAVYGSTGPYNPVGPGTGFNREHGDN